MADEYVSIGGMVLDGQQLKCLQ